ncbi:mannose-1-phosphate guanylyltransferase/mannose-6-phosphate isomerase [Paludibacterium denitrificans]|nr:mannose-1-phosphate guanylyltransferase/mannose-6-phosphate isomerase [Paludibacterium denitrificans]
MIPIILSGGSGSRLWPLSRGMFPKQFLSLCNKETMLQSTLQRMVGIPDLDSPTVVCNEEHRFIVAEQLREIKIAPSAIILEPAGRNTAPAVAVAALAALQKEDDPLLLVLAADHVIQDIAAFQNAITQARDLASNGALVTFGIVPTHPETGYGYIELGRPVDRTAVGMLINRFVEKPNLALAQQYVNSGSYLWNSGMFLFKASAVLAELATHAPDILLASKLAMESATVDHDFLRLDAEAFTACRTESIDHAVMEKTANAVVLPLQAGWSDVGSWDALWEVSKHDAAGNVLHGDVISEASHNCYLYSNEGRLLAVHGVDDLIVVNTEDAVLVTRRGQSQNVKNIVEVLKLSARREAEQHCRVYRPWGSYHRVDAGKRYQVKRITVNPGARLSVQMHHHRAEHWIVVSGTAKVLHGKEDLLLTENQSIYIPVGEVHSLENPGKIPLELIEVQSGAYLGEDDIVRLKDRYGRT